jgi:hypothetical protein
VGGPNSDEGTEILVLYVRVYYNSSTLDAVYSSGEVSEVCVTLGGAWAHGEDPFGIKMRIPCIFMYIK